jgi:uncharacterized surface protein with fasciclin (FAS1) repeats
MRKPFTAVLVAAGLAVPAIALPGTAAAAPAAGQAEKNLVETASGDPRFTTLVSLVGRAGLADELSGDAKLTVFAPTDAAFAKLPAAKLRQLGRNKALLKKVLLYHVVAGDVKAEQVVRLRSVRTLAKRKVRIRVRDESVILNRRSKVVQTDVAASNGTIHVINRVLLPPAAR